ncbi:MAG TPA: aspartate aminotransferase family protein [Bryobacteraceae bacterium]|nr:aspartate aminotransferase family protein [Bryobacteraceae bacterium]
MALEFPLLPVSVPRVETPLRRIVTDLPVPESLPILQKLRHWEPRSMSGQPPIVWNRAEGFQVYDSWGNCWIDLSSGVLVANAGHGRPELIEAITAQAQSALLTNYCFPSEIRARLVERLGTLLPEPLKKILLLTTGSETVECAIKLCRTYGLKVGGRDKHIILSFHSAFHGRTLGAQQAGGIDSLKDWIVNLDSGFLQLPFPDGYRTPDTSFESFLRYLKDYGVREESIAGVIVETYQGGSAAFADPAYIVNLREWCIRNHALLVFDEVQAGFGRTGTLWGFQHYGITPDLALFGKGISSSLPLSAVAGRPDVMDLPGVNTMTSTHTGNPVCCAAALASIEVIMDHDLVGNARRTGDLLHSCLHEIHRSCPNIGFVHGRGLVAGLLCVHPGTKDPDGALAWDVVRRCYEKGILLFAPVGVGGATVKLAPPLVITEEAIMESTCVLAEAIEEATASSATETTLTRNVLRTA